MSRHVTCARDASTYRRDRVGMLRARIAAGAAYSFAKAAPHILFHVLDVPVVPKQWSSQ